MSSIPQGRELFRLLLASCLFVFAGGCAASPPANEPPAAAVVIMHLHSFEPDVVTIVSGQTVRWENKSFIWHTVTADPALARNPQDVALPPGADPFDSGKVDLGGRYSHTF